MFKKILIANRGEIACRIIRTLKKMRIASVAVYSAADADSLHVCLADEAILIGPAPAAESYLKVERILAAAQQSGAQAIHPGYGFLSENPAFAQACADAGISFIGPTPAQMLAFGLKHTARERAQALGVPLLPGSDLLADSQQAVAEAARIGYPVMLKSTAGGGGIGMRLCWQAHELVEAFAAVHRLAASNFKDAGIYLEKFVQQARHIEVQIFGDGRGAVVALGERDCSVQRRNQKVIEETPAPDLSEQQRQQLFDMAIRLAQSINYQSAGTVEFVYDKANREFYFLEVNTRLQVEHAVTELVTGIDLVEGMIKQAAGEMTLAELKIKPRGASIQVRLYAENPANQFQPCPGILTEVFFPADVRVDTWVERGTEVSPFYDPLIAKLIVHGDARATALAALRRALAATRLAGIETNRVYLQQIVDDAVFRDGAQTTHYLNNFNYRPHTVDVLEAGVQSTIQDFPGRLGYWQVGVPPSGPMDDLAFRLANRLLGNLEDAAGLEFTVAGPTLRFNMDCVIALTGADMQPSLNGSALKNWTAISVKAGDVLRLKNIHGQGLRTYLAVRGGFDVPRYLGSRATFTLGQFGGHAGRTLRTGDVLHIETSTATTSPASTLATSLIPEYRDHWEIGVLYGPHGAPDFFTPEDIEIFFSSDWQVHYNSSRTGVRLMGPKPNWARADGGEAGLHPSNIHDNAYAIGAIDFTGDMPVILGPDGPSLGGFVCPAVVVRAERWKLGQLRPGNRVRFRPLTRAQAADRETAQEHMLATLQATDVPRVAASHAPLQDAVLARIAADAHQVEVVYRQAGDKYLLVEYGPPVLDLSLRFRAHALMQCLQQQQLRGIVDLTPGIRSLQVHFDNRVLPLARLLDALSAAERELPRIETMQVPSRIVHLPLAWNDSQTQLAIEKYTQSVRPDAPWCPSNIEFIRRINGLADVDEVRRIVFDASYMVLGLGDVYLGAPVATPLDPRHRLVTTKYNPARTWTPENAVGIGGAYLCIYGMEGPGGYQFVGRTLQMWNRYRSTVDFKPDAPWLLRFFDQIRFFPVSEAELMQMRADFPLGRYQLQIEEKIFRLSEYQTFLQKNQSAIGAFKNKQQSAFEAERLRWLQSDQTATDSVSVVAAPELTLDLPPGGRSITAHVAGNLWKIEVAEGDSVEAGDVLLIIESMKMEINITAPCRGRIHKLICRAGIPVSAGQDLLVMLESAA
ncbi:MAG: urea carboxylase [Gammaproteobacteria bacterium]|nr:urea carboxylase [Gammaproteobacteria bacterium]